MAINKSGDSALGDILPADLYPLGEIDQMRRGIQPGPVTLRSKDRLDHCRCRSFAVGTGNVNRQETPLRIPDPVEKLRNVLESELHPEELAREDKPFGRCVGMAYHDGFPPR